MNVRHVVASTAICGSGQSSPLLAIQKLYQTMSTQWANTLFSCGVRVHDVLTSDYRDSDETADGAELHSGNDHAHARSERRLGMYSCDFFSRRRRVN